MAMAGRTILDEARIHDDVAEALAGTDVSFAVSRFGGRHRPNPVTPDSAAKILLEHLPAARAALVFGSEDFGLSREQCAGSWGYLSIPTGGSAQLDLALAVAVVVQAFAAEALARGPVGRESEGERAHLAARLIALLERVGFMASDDPGCLRPKVLAVLARAELDPREVKVLHGVLGQVEKHLVPGPPGGAS
ncbi:MAG: hypothetical protein IPK07_33585 [Deltaproteobacteria bacterium]|nr:hypothetical protein [Deltaproteobacteria bacterium]